MKNLKNRPKRKIPIVEGNAWFNVSTEVYDSDEVDEWFEGFEKELKNLLKEDEDSDYNICNSCVMRSTCLEYGFECKALQKLKEILG